MTYKKNSRRLKLLGEIIARSKKKKLKILELGVLNGASTKLILKSKKVKQLISVDIYDCSNVSKKKNWKFIQTRDDNFTLIDKYFKKVDIIFIDSYHEPNHVEKLIYFYFKKIKVGGQILIDDISWLQHVKGAPLDNDFTERINRLTFKKIIEIYYSNQNNFDLNIEFCDSGLAIIKKIKNNNLNSLQKVPNRSFSIKNVLKKIYDPKPIPNSKSAQ
jgi:predicted O-methyltransferase YrrM